MLRAAAIAFDRAGARGRDGDEARAMRRALIAGRWTLVETFEEDGKRFLIARRNRSTPTSTPMVGLSVRETQVAVFTAMGRSLKTIGYELGLSDSCVATYLRRALAKLRLPDRLALTRRLGFLEDAQADPAVAPV